MTQQFRATTPLSQAPKLYLRQTNLKNRTAFRHCHAMGIQCSGNDTYYSTACQQNDLYLGCFSENPCQDEALQPANLFAGGAATSSTAATSSAAASSPAATSTLDTATSTQGTLRTSSAQIKITTSSSSNHLILSSNLPATSSQTASATPSASAQAATPVAISSSAPTGTQGPSLPAHSKKAAVAAGTVGAIVGAIFALILIFLVLRWRKRRTSQHWGANGAGSALQDKDGFGKP